MGFAIFHTRNYWRFFDSNRIQMLVFDCLNFYFLFYHLAFQFLSSIAKLHCLSMQEVHYSFYALFIFFLIPFLFFSISYWCFKYSHSLLYWRLYSFAFLISLSSFCSILWDSLLIFLDYPSIEKFALYFYLSSSAFAMISAFQIPALSSCD